MDRMYSCTLGDSPPPWARAGAGGAAGSRPRWRTVAAPLSLRGSGAAHTLRVVYALACPGSALDESVSSCADTYVPKRLVVALPQHGWLVLCRAVNIAFCFIY